MGLSSDSISSSERLAKGAPGSLGHHFCGVVVRSGAQNGKQAEGQEVLRGCGVFWWVAGRDIFGGSISWSRLTKNCHNLP